MRLVQRILLCFFTVFNNKEREDKSDEISYTWRPFNFRNTAWKKLEWKENGLGPAFTFWQMIMINVLQFIGDGKQTLIERNTFHLRFRNKYNIRLIIYLFY